MKGDAVKELAERLREPKQLGDIIVSPPNWTAHHVNELKKFEPHAPGGPKAAPLKVATLGAIRDYLKANRDGLKLETLLVHVETPHRVTIGSALRNPARDRELYLTAEATDMVADFLGKWTSAELFNIGLQTRFVNAEQLGALLTAVSSVKIEQSAEAIDNGLTQTLEARQGAVLKSHVSLPNPVTLTPFRTFRDIMQPSSPFILRANAEEGKLPQLALFEADGGTWKLTAIERIKDWLTIELKDLNVAVLA